MEQKQVVTKKDIVQRITLYYYNKASTPESGRIPRSTFDNLDLVYKREIDLMFSMVQFLFFWDMIDVLVLTEINNTYFIEEDKYERYCKMVQLMLDHINREIVE